MVQAVSVSIVNTVAGDLCEKKWYRERFLFRVFLFSPVSIIPPMFNILTVPPWGVSARFRFMAFP